MNARLIRLDRPRDLGAAVLRRLRWNPHVLGALAYPMEAHPAAAAWGVAPLDSGHHIRWSLDPRRGEPTAGVYVFSRSHESHADLPTYAHNFMRDEAARGTLMTFDVGEPAVLRLMHPSGLRITPQSGLELPADRSPLVVTLPTSGRSVTLHMAGVRGGAEVTGTHAGHLIHYERTMRPEPDFTVTILDSVDQVRISAPGARIRLLTWIRVPGDLAGWLPLAHFPPLGTAPYDSASIAARLNGVTVDSDLIGNLQTVLSNLEATSPPISWPADGGGPGLDVEAGTLLSVLTLQPQMAAAFGRYMVDQNPTVVPTDYLVVAAWLPSVSPGGQTVDTLIDSLTERDGLLYFAPCYAIEASRAWDPRPARLDSFVAVDSESRRQLDARGHAIVELPLQAEWSLRPEGRPILAAQETPLAVVSFTGPGADEGTRVVTSSRADRQRTLVEVVSPRVARLPGSVDISLTPLDLFGHLTEPAATGTASLSADIYPTAPPPIGVLPQLVPTSRSPDLNVTWLWGGRLRLFHPDVHGFIAEWVQDTDLPAGTPRQEALRDASLTWHALPRTNATAPRAMRVDALGVVVAGRTAAAILLREDDEWIAGVQTDLRIAAAATGRFNAWALKLGVASFVVDRHTLGDSAWFFVRLPSGAAGTPFASLVQDVEQPFNMAWSLTGPAADTSVAVRVSGASADMDALAPGSLITQGSLVFPVLAQRPGTLPIALLDLTTGSQEPGGPAPDRPLPAVGDVLFDAPTTVRFAAVPVSAPTASHANREIWVRVSTIDALDRRGAPGTPMGTAWAKAFPPVPAEGPIVVRRSPPDAFGYCKLLVRFERTLADHGSVLFRASDAQITVTLARAQQAVATRPPADSLPAFTALPAGFVWPAGGPQSPEEVVNPLVDFASDPDMLRVFCNELRIDEGASTGPRPVFIDAFERRGRMTKRNHPAELFAGADDEPLELEDVVDRAGNQYLFLVRLIDRASQEGDPSGVSLPGQGWDIKAPAAPALLPVLVTPDELIVRWNPVPDSRVTRYRVTRTPLWNAAPPPEITARTPERLASPIRVEGDRVSLPAFTLTPQVSRVTSIRTIADDVERVADGFVAPADQQFVWWCAAGNRALVVAAGVRDRVPAAHSGGVTDGADVNPVPLTLTRGVLDGDALGIAPAAFDALLVQETERRSVDRTATGTWQKKDFLTAPATLEEGDTVVLETTSPEGVRRTKGQCPAAPADAAIAITDGCVPLAAVASRLAAGDRPSGLFRASEVTGADTTGAPDPRGSGATNLIGATTWYRFGFVRRLRDGVPMVLRWRRLSDGTERFIITAGARPVRFLDGSLVVPPWNPADETLDGVYDRSTVSVSGDSVSIPTGARNMASDVAADATTGRVVTLVPDGAPVRVRRQRGAQITARFEALTWWQRQLSVDGLFGDALLKPSALYTLEPDAGGQLVPRTDRNRLATTELAPDGSALVATGLPADGASISVEYDGDGISRTVDPRRLELSFALIADDVGREWEIKVEALCDFPNPVGLVTSPPAVTRIAVTPPAIQVSVTSALWTDDGALEVQYAGPAELIYRIEAVSRPTGVRYVLTESATGGVVTTGAATDGSLLPLNAGLSIQLTAWFANAADRPYIAAPVFVDSLLPEPID